MAIPQTAPAAQLKIGESVPTPLTLTIADLKNLHRTTLHVMNPHEKKIEVYEGVLLEELLQKAGAPHGEQLPRAADDQQRDCGGGGRLPSAVRASRT